MNTENVICRPIGVLNSRALLPMVGIALALGLLLHSHPTFAAESTSFQLYDSFPHVSDQGPDRSDSFLMNENGVTWVAQPIASTSFQIVTAPPVSSSSASSVGSSVSSVSSSSTPATGGHRGNRIPPALHPSAGQRTSSPIFSASSVSSVSSLSSASSHSSEGFASSDGGVSSSSPFAVGVTPPGGSLQPDSHSAAHCVGEQCLCSRFLPARMCVAASYSAWSFSGIASAIIEVVLFLFISYHFIYCNKRSR